jgi:phosphatidylserine/phosphatidylglycerophosphate/cardiolipin synthase-like enzyme
MPKCVNLNKLITDKKRKQFIRYGNIKLMFDTQSILNNLTARIRRQDTVFVMGCAAWFTNSRIIKALSELKGVSIICTRDKVARLKSTKLKYRTLPQHDGIPTVLVVGCGRGRKASLMHHKFLIGMNEKQIPIWVSTGSFNLTESATSNIENMMIIENKEIAKAFLEEFQRLYPLAKKLSLKV